MRPTLEHSDKKQAHLMKERKYFSYNKRGHTIYDSIRKEKIVAILENFIENNSSK